MALLCHCPQAGMAARFPLSPYGTVTSGLAPLMSPTWCSEDPSECGKGKTNPVPPLSHPLLSSLLPKIRPRGGRSPPSCQPLNLASMRWQRSTRGWPRSGTRSSRWISPCTSCSGFTGARLSQRSMPAEGDSVGTPGCQDGSRCPPPRRAPHSPRGSAEICWWLSETLPMTSSCLPGSRHSRTLLGTCHPSGGPQGPLCLCCPPTQWCLHPARRW